MRVAPIALLALPFATAGCSLLSSFTTPSSSSATPASSEPASSPRSDLSSAPSESPAAAAEPATPVSVTLRNGCGETVSVFFGDKPKFGSGTYSSLSSNTSTSHSFMPGDMFWIVDEGRNGVASVTVAEDTSSIKVQEGCTSLGAR